MRPELLEIQLTHKCNLQCIYCGNNADLLKLPDLDVCTVLKVISELKPKKLLFTGGEVYMAFQSLIEILEALRGKDYEMILSSNLTMISTNELKLLIDEYHFKTFHTSFNDLDNNMSKQIRKTSMKERKNLLTNIKYLTQNGCKVKVETILIPNTIEHLVEINHCLYDLGVRHHKIEFLLPLGVATNDMMCNCKTIEDSILDLYYNKNNDSTIEMTCFYFTPCSNETNRIFNLLNDKSDFIYNECVDGSRSCYLLANGQLLPCFLFPDNVYDTNAKIENAYDIWMNHELFQKFRSSNSDCMKCDYYMKNENSVAKTCNNGCPVLNYVSSGEFASKAITPTQIDCRRV